MRVAAGWCIALAGTALAVRSGSLLLGRGRPRRGPQPAFVIAGPYRRIRNPLFAGIVVALCGASLVVGSLVLAAGTVVLAAALHLWVVRVEEPRLRARFGSAYVAYLAHVPRWLPRFRNPVEPDEA